MSADIVQFTLELNRSEAITVSVEQVTQMTLNVEKLVAKTHSIERAKFFSVEL